MSPVLSRANRVDINSMNTIYFLDLTIFIRTAKNESEKKLMNIESSKGGL